MTDAARKRVTELIMGLKKTNETLTQEVSLKKTEIRDLNAEKRKAKAFEDSLQDSQKFSKNAVKFYQDFLIKIMDQGEFFG
jgi:hypothetical protein